MNSRLLEPKSSALPTGLHPDIQFYMVVNADFTQKDNQCQEKTIEKRFPAVVVKTVVKPGFEAVLRNTQSEKMLVSQHILGFPNRGTSIWLQSPKSSALPTGPHPDIENILYSMPFKNATGKWRAGVCIFADSVV